MKAKIIDGKIVISVDIDNLQVAADGYWAYSGGSPKIKIIDNNVFSKELCHELNREKEDGTTLVHVMLDSAFRSCVENGLDGFEFIE